MLDAESLKLIWTALTFILPRPVTIDPDEAGNLVRRGRVKPYHTWCAWLWGKRNLGPGGWVWIWPPIERVASLNVSEQDKDLRIQTVWTKDMHELSISGAYSYVIVDVEKAQFNAVDYETRIMTEMIVTVCHYINTRTKEDCQNVELVSKKLMSKLKKRALESWGIELTMVGITDVLESKAIRHLGIEGLTIAATIEKDT